MLLTPTLSSFGEEREETSRDSCILQFVLPPLRLCGKNQFIERVDRRCFAEDEP